MSDIWAFLLQTLTASGAAVLLLSVKELFRDKLPPKWHFAIWGILAIILLIPAGIGGRYVLFNWPLAVETLKTMVAGEYTFTRVQFPFPILSKVPQTVFDWLFAIYFLGVILHLMKYAVAYLRLRFILRRGFEADTELLKRIDKLAAEQKVTIKKVVAVSGLPSAFVCGVFRPILALPGDTEMDDKILLHELLHLKQKDTVWSIVICILRSVHWCNPLLVYCAKRAGNDLEARCDQRVLEKLEGEDRRDYGMILLSMTNDRFARTPGATCANNGGRNIRRRIEAIARFKLYPSGMALVAVCAAIILAVPMILGVEATEVYDLGHSQVSAQMAFASARAVPCTTVAGALDAYGKAVLDQNGIYRAMCAPAAMQKDLAESVTERYENGGYPYWDTGLESWPDSEEGYYIYNLNQVSDTAYEGMLVIQLNYRPDGKETEFGRMVLACQDLRVEKEGHRWVTVPLEDFRWGEYTRQQFSWGAAELPSYVYAATAGNIQVEVKVQSIHVVDNTVETTNDLSFLFGPTISYDMVPRPHAEFEWVRYSKVNVITHLGTQEERNRIERLGLSVATITEGSDRPCLSPPAAIDGTGSSNQGTSWSSRAMEPGWGPVEYMNGSGSSGPADVIGADLPGGFAVDLYINGEKAAELDLTLQEGGPQ